MSEQTVRSQTTPDILSVVRKIGKRSETWLYRQITCLRRHTIHTLSQDHVNAREYPLEHITVCHTLSGRIIRNSLRPLGLLRFAASPMGRRLRQLLTRSDFRILQAHFGGVAAEYHDILVTDGRPLVVWLYGSDVFREAACRHQYLPKLFESRAHICCTSNALKNECVALGCRAEKIEVIYPGIDMPSAREERKSGEGMRIVSVGRLIDFKDPLALVEVARRLNERGMKFQWSHFGGGSLRPAVEGAIERAGIAGRFILRGEVPNARVLKELNQADLMVHRAVVASDGGRESFGVVLIEAASRGVPIVANPVGGIPEVVVHGQTGFLPKADGTEAMAECVLKLDGSPDLRRAMGRAAVERAEAMFDIRKQAEKLDRYYDGLIHEA